MGAIAQNESPDQKYIDQASDRQLNQSIDRSINRSIYQSINQPMGSTQHK